MYKVNVKSDQRILIVCNSGMMAYSFDAKQVSYLPQGIYCFNVEDYKRFYFDGELKVFPLHWDNLIGYDIENINYSTMEQKQVVEESGTIVAEYNSPTKYELMGFGGNDDRIFDFDSNGANDFLTSGHGAIGYMSGANLLIASSGSDLIAYDLQGNEQWRYSYGNSVYNVWCGEDYVIGITTGKVNYLDSNGNESWNYTNAGRCLGVDSNGNVFYYYVSGDQIQKLDSGGSPLSYFSTTISVNSITVLPNDEVVFGGSLGELVKVSNDLSTELFSKTPKANKIDDLDSDDDGNIYAACWDGSVSKYDSGGIEQFSISFGNTLYAVHVNLNSEKAFYVGGASKVGKYDLEGNFDYSHILTAGCNVITTAFVNEDLI